MRRDRDLQLRILRSVRGDGDDESLEGLPDELVAYNAALLIDQGLVEGKAIKDNSGQYVSAALTALTSAGHDFLDGLETEQQPSTPEGSAHRTMTIFISHSSRDTHLAERLVNLLRLAFSLPVDEIRCTSVDRLAAGADTDDQLRREVRESQLFLALITPSSVRSSYVLFELGARWGTELPLFPLFGRRADSNSLAGPLRGINALNICRRQEVLQLLEDIGAQLKRHPAAPSAIDSDIEAVLIEAAKADSTENSTKPNHEQCAVHELPEEEARILIHLFDQDCRISPAEIAKEFSLSSSEAKHYLDKLRSREFVGYRPAVVPAYGPKGRVPETYGITEQGRDYVMKQRANKRAESNG